MKLPGWARLSGCSPSTLKGKSLALGVSSQLTLYALQADGTLGTNHYTGSCQRKSHPRWPFDTSGRFLYGPGLPRTRRRLHRVSTFLAATLLETSNSPLPSRLFHRRERGVVDPTAPLILRRSGLSEHPRKQGFLPPSFRRVLWKHRSLQSRPPGTQPVLGPIANHELPRHCAFGRLVTRPTSSAQTLTYHQNGGHRPASLEYSPPITGANPRGLCGNGHCHVPTVLQPGRFTVPVLITFTPSATGSRTAALNNHEQCFSRHAICSVERHSLPQPRCNTRPLQPRFLSSVTLGTSTPMAMFFVVTNSPVPAALHILGASPLEERTPATTFLRVPRAIPPSRSTRAAR